MDANEGDRIVVESERPAQSGKTRLLVSSSRSSSLSCLVSSGSSPHTSSMNRSASSRRKNTSSESPSGKSDERASSQDAPPRSGASRFVAAVWFTYAGASEG